MQLALCAVGKLRSGPEAELVNDYAGRIRSTGRSVGLNGFDIKEVEAPKGLAGEKRQARESALLEQAAPESGMRLVLDERGKNLTSQEFARLLARFRDDGAKSSTFFIGGADGHDAAFIGRADARIALGSLTWPHMLVRAMVCEQLYRAVTILSGHPYHRD